MIVKSFMKLGVNIFLCKFCEISSQLDKHTLAREWSEVEFLSLPHLSPPHTYPH